MGSDKRKSREDRATSEEVMQAFSDIDEATVAAILALSPSVAEIEEAALWDSGEGETLTRRHQPRGTVAAILELVAREDDEAERRGT